MSLDIFSRLVVNSLGEGGGWGESGFEDWLKRKVGEARPGGEGAAKQEAEDD